MYYLRLIFNIVCSLAYSDRFYTIVNLDDNSLNDTHCSNLVFLNHDARQKLKGVQDTRSTSMMYNFTYRTQSKEKKINPDPLETYEAYIMKILYGPKIDTYDKNNAVQEKLKHDLSNDGNRLHNYVMGNFMHHFTSSKMFECASEIEELKVVNCVFLLSSSGLFQNKSIVYLPMTEFMYKGHCVLKLTKDYMQTAVNAFSIFLEGNVNDVLRMPSQYVLSSARTISMMKIAREKLAATWIAVKGEQDTIEITHQTLELYRPLFKYLNGREMARLNLSDDRILSFIGTHAELDRHQVGVVASKYIKLNPDWREAKYLNLMNNLLCGVPMSYMRKIHENVYLQLSHQIFYHIRACDPLQRRFYLAMMIRTQVLGKSFSWNARDVSRLGLLLTELDGTELSTVNPKAMSGITAQVMLEMPPHILQYITENQMRYIGPKPLNILASKMKIYDQLRIYNYAYRIRFTKVHLIMIIKFVL